MCEALLVHACSELVNEIVKGWDAGAEALSGTDLLDEDAGLACWVEGVAVEALPMREDALREGTAGRSGSEGLSETERLGDGKEGLHVDERSAWNGVFLVDDTSTLGEALVDATNGVIRALDLDKEDRLDESGLGGEFASVEDTSGGGHDLTATSMDSIGVEGHILDVESNTSHVLVGQDTLLGGPLEGGLNGVLDFVKVLDLLGDINDQVGAGGVGSEAPDLLGIIRIPLVFVLENTSSFPLVLLGADRVVFDLFGEFVTKRSSSSKDSVVLVGGLGEADLAGLANDGFLVGDNGVTLLDWALGVLLLEILEADLDVELTAAGNNVLTRLLSRADDERIGLGELAETFDELGEIGGVLDFDGNTHDRGHGVLHDLDAVSVSVIRDGALLHEVLINTDETDGVTAGDVTDSLDLTSHHDDGTLDVFHVEIVSGAWLVVWSHDSDLLASGDGTGENTAESVESSLVVGGDHLGDEDHERTVLVTVLDGLAARIIDGAFVEHSSSVLLGLLGGRKLHDDHLNEGLSGINPFLEDALHEILGSLVLLVVSEGDVEGLKHLPDGFKVVVHAVTAELDDGAHDKLDEASLEFLAVLSLALSLELLGGGVEVVVAPEFLHESLTVQLELLRVSGGKSGQGEGPAEKCGTEGNGTLGWVNLVRLTHVLELVGGDDDVGVLNDTLEVLEHGLTIDLELQDASVNLVDHHDGLDLLGKGLTEDSLSLHANTLDVIDDDKSAISDTESSGDLGGEINVAWGVDKVDQVRLDRASLDDVSLEVERHTSRLDGNATFLFVLTSISGAGITSRFAGNDTGFSNKRVREGGLSMVDVSDDGHVPDLVSFVHDLTDLLNGEVGHVAEWFSFFGRRS